jgi:A/G-specific adenine glycosylase
VTLSGHNNKVSPKHIPEFRTALLRWYDSHTREVPWRVMRGETPDPYKIWLSEIMCQQTTVQAVKPYYAKFLKKWPTVSALAAAKEADILTAWAGLGYYARARNLHKCAQIVANDLGGQFPRTEKDLKALPGIGDYTAAAISAIAFGAPAIVVDGNVERVMARFFALEEPLPQAKPALKALAAHFYKDFHERPGDLAQAFMDLGANICIPKAPRCALCPLNNACQGYKKGRATALPLKRKTTQKPLKHGYVYWLENAKGQILFQKRPDKGLLAGMIGLPTTAWESATPPKPLQSSLFKHCKPRKQNASVSIDHTFTHFDLKLTPLKGTVKSDPPALPEGFYWAKPEKELEKLPSLFKKAFITLSSL